MARRSPLVGGSGGGAATCGGAAGATGARAPLDQLGCAGIITTGAVPSSAPIDRWPTRISSTPNTAPAVGLYAISSSTMFASIDGSVTATGEPAITTRRVSSRASMRSTLRDTLRRMPSLTWSNGSPTNCAISRVGSAHRTWIDPVARSRTGIPVVGMRKLVIMSNETSTAEVSTKNAATGRVGSGVR